MFLIGKERGIPWDNLFQIDIVTKAFMVAYECISIILYDLQVHWGQHPLRPEFLESTYLLYLATDDPYYLRVGEQVLRSLQKHAWVPCGYAAVKDVRTGVHEDR